MGGEEDWSDSDMVPVVHAELLSMPPVKDLKPQAGISQTWG